MVQIASPRATTGFSSLFLMAWRRKNVVVITLALILALSSLIRREQRLNLDFLSASPPRTYIPSPYEQRTGKKLVDWARKNSYERYNNSTAEVCFVHVGKTAGSTLGCLLGFRASCYGTAVLGGILPEATEHMMHNQYNDCYEETPYYLFTTRHPLDRIKSWFIYERSFLEGNHDAGYCGKQRKKLFIKCPFPTLQQFAENGLGRDSSVSSKCQERAWDAIRGRDRYCKHNFYNYAYFYGQTPAKAKILTIRTEHLLDDWNAAESYLYNIERQKPPTLFQAPAFPQLHQSYKKKSDKKELSSKAQLLLCQALCDEIQIYKQVLKRSVNLSQEQLSDSLKALASSCPTEAESSKCASYNE